LDGKELFVKDDILGKQLKKIPRSRKFIYIEEMENGKYDLNHNYMSGNLKCLHL